MLYTLDRQYLELRKRQREWDDLLGEPKDNCASQYNEHSLQDEPLEET